MQMGPQTAQQGKTHTRAMGSFECYVWFFAETCTFSAFSPASFLPSAGFDAGIQRESCLSACTPDPQRFLQCLLQQIAHATHACMRERDTHTQTRSHVRTALDERVRASPKCTHEEKGEERGADVFGRHLASLCLLEIALTVASSSTRATHPTKTRSLDCLILRLFLETQKKIGKLRST